MLISVSVVFQVSKAFVYDRYIGFSLADSTQFLL